MYILQVFRSRYCQIVFILSMGLAYLIVPKTALKGEYWWLAWIFVLLLAISLTCTVRNIKEKVKAAKTVKSSIITTLLAAIGISALQVCGMGAPMCGVSVGLSLGAIIFPSAVFNLLERFPVWSMVLVIFLQIISLLLMRCFQYQKKNKFII